MPLLPNPEDAENNPEIEHQWAVNAGNHAEVYFNLISSTDSTTLKLTQLDFLFSFLFSFFFELVNFFLIFFSE